MPGTLSELIFAGTSGALSDGKLTITPDAPTAGAGITTAGLEITNAHTYSAGDGLSLTKAGDAHSFSNTKPVCAFTVAGNTYAAGAIDEVVFGPGASATISGSQLSINGFGASGDTVVPGAGISISESGGVKTVTNTAPAPAIILDGVPQTVTSLAFKDFVTTTSGGAVTNGCSTPT